MIDDEALFRIEDRADTLHSLCSCKALVAEVRRLKSLLDSEATCPVCHTDVQVQGDRPEGTVQLVAKPFRG
jgi:hypothetical protein